MGDTDEVLCVCTHTLVCVYTHVRAPPRGTKLSSELYCVIVKEKIMYLVDIVWFKVCRQI
jgi:hypothetical protein